jgi:hypothetical protein
VEDMVKISVIMVTAREDKETNFEDWKNISKHLYDKHIGYSGIRSVHEEPNFVNLLIKHIKDDMYSFIEPTVSALDAQTFKDFELIIIDRLADNRKIKFNKTNMSMRIIRDKPTLWNDLKTPEGWSTDLEVKYPAVCSARNTGIIAANGELLFFIDDNIIFDEGLLQKIWGHYGDGYGVKVCRHRFNITKNIITLEKEFADFKWGDNDTLPYKYRGAWSNGFTVPLEAALRVNGFNEDLDGVTGGEDIDFGERLEKLNYNPILIDRDCEEWELGHLHMGTNRYCVRDNGILLEVFRRNNSQPIEANRVRPTCAIMDEYDKRFVAVHPNEKVHPYYDRCMDVPTFDLRKMRDRRNE